ncbi:hypothetical protein ACFORH_42815 [Amycolatopsis roodepoortensis]|uniref:Uncharacterized protein n=1 Tax=Amycolatopsis roodepoortensis TaxID=700274 RepID=A0ABR9L3R9_9PSEU|nr:MULTISPECIES: hypothetical protein [Amycolatopsis]MBE1575022.1 hypothetical protein [Amycolatopsis roodepoortensis]
MISSKCLTDPRSPRHAMPPEFEDRPDEHEHNVARIVANATETPELLGGLRLVTPYVHGVHRKVEPGDTIPLPRIEAMAHAAFLLGAQLGAMGADVRMARVERGLCAHCQRTNHYTTVRIYPLPDPRDPDAPQTVPDACACCAPGVLRAVQDASSGRAPIVVEVWHPKPESINENTDTEGDDR